MLTGLLIAVVSLAVLGGALVWAQRRQNAALQRLRQRIELVASNNDVPVASTTGLAPLPSPVERYLAHVLPSNRGSIRLLRYVQSGRLRTDGSSERWLDFRARQVVAPAATAFLWDARVALFPLLHLRVIDSLVDGRGSGQVALLSALSLGKAAGGLEMNSGSLHRFLAEAVWYPTALLPSKRLQWQPIDEHRALATLSACGISVSLEFRFNQRDEIESVYTPARWGSFSGGYRQLPWEGRFSNYVMRDAVLVPEGGEVGWVSDGEWRPVWQGRIGDMLVDWN